MFKSLAIPISTAVSFRALLRSRARYEDHRPGGPASPITESVVHSNGSPSHGEPHDMPGRLTPAARFVARIYPAGTVAFCLRISGRRRSAQSSGRRVRREGWCWLFAGARFSTSVPRLPPSGPPWAAGREHARGSVERMSTLVGVRPEGREPAGIGRDRLHEGDPRPSLHHAVFLALSATSPNGPTPRERKTQAPPRQRPRLASRDRSVLLAPMAAAGWLRLAVAARTGRPSGQLSRRPPAPRH